MDEPKSESEEFKLNEHPSDSVSRVTFSPRENLLAVSSWDSSVGLYDMTSNTLRSKYHHQSAVLDVCFGDMAHSYSGGLDNLVKMHDWTSESGVTLGEHNKPVRCVEYNPIQHLLVSGSWDQTIKLWDPRTPGEAVSTHAHPGKIFSLCLSSYRVVVATSSRNIWIWDIRNTSEPEQKRESSLKFQTRAVRAFIEGDGYAVSSTEGRVAIEYFDPAPQVQALKYAFKCHRSKRGDGIEEVFPANCMAFHPIYGTFATGGCDGIVNIWDGKNKKRIHQFKKYPQSISSLSFNHDGTFFAVAASDTYFDPEKQNKGPEDIFIRKINDQEVRPSSRK